MLVTIIGSGNIASVLGGLLLRSGHSINQVYSRTPRHAAELAEQLSAEAVSQCGQLKGNSDVYLLAVSDDALAGVASQLTLGAKLAIHTSGSVSKEVLCSASSRYGVLWPMKMIRRNMTTIENATIVVDGNCDEVTVEVEKIACQFSPVITRAGDELRSKMHMIAAITSNFTNHLYHLAADYCAAEGINFSFFYPLIIETAMQLKVNHPRSVQAGPAFRGDLETIRKHGQLLQAHPQLQQLYEAISASINFTFSDRIDNQG